MTMTIQAVYEGGVLRPMQPLAIEEGETPLPRSGRGHIVIKSVSPKQRPRRQ